MPQPNEIAQATPQIEVDFDAYLGTVSAQRNQALDAVAQQAGVIARLQKQIAELKDQLPVREPDAITVRPGPRPVPPAAE